MSCITHHNACDCREAEFQRLREENARLRMALANIEFCPRSMSENIIPDMQEIAREALKPKSPHLT